MTAPFRVGRAAGARSPGGLNDLVLVGLFALAIAASLALVMSDQAPLALLAVLALPAGLVVVRRPDLLVPAVAFLLYTNAAVVGAHFHGLPVAVPAAVPLLLCLPIARDILLGGQRILLTSTFWLLLIFVAFQFVGALFSIRPERSVGSLVSILTEGVILYLLVSNAIRTRKVLKGVVWAVILAAALIGAIGAHQQLTGSFDSEYGGFAQVSEASLDTSEGKRTQPRLAGPIGEENRFSQIMAMAIPLALFMGMAAHGRSARWAAFGCLILILIGTALGFSRGALVGVGMMFAAMMALGYVRWRHVGLVAIAIVVAGLAVPQYGVRVLSLVKVAGAAVDHTGVGNADGATRGRLTEMWASILVFADHPVLGVGPGMNPVHYPEYARLAGGKVTTEERQAHSLFPGLAAEHGLPGVLLFSAMLFLTLRDLSRARRRFADQDPELALIATALIMTLIVYLTTSIFLHAGYIRYFWFVMAVAGATAHLTVTSRDDGRPGWT